MVKPRDESVRARFATELDRNFSVVASAGSGKTTGIIERILSIARSPNAAEILPRLVRGLRLLFGETPPPVGGVVHQPASSQSPTHVAPIQSLPLLPSITRPSWKTIAVTAFTIFAIATLTTAVWWAASSAPVPVPSARLPVPKVGSPQPTGAPDCRLASTGSLAGEQMNSLGSASRRK